MPTIAGRQRPIEKFAEAVGRCGVEVRFIERSFLKLMFTSPVDILVAPSPLFILSSTEAAFRPPQFFSAFPSLLYQFSLIALV